MVIDRFVDPEIKLPLEHDQSGNLFCERDGRKAVYARHGSSYDFVSKSDGLGDERNFYDSAYKQSAPGSMTAASILSPWIDETRPWNRTLLESLGEISGKKILILGNGNSSKELQFLELGAEVVYTDLSIEAVVAARDAYLSSSIFRADHKIDFHAVDALRTPFADETFDIVYGYAFAHHIEELDQLLAEAKRCLKKGGICRFFDDAYSPAFQFLKATFLKPLQWYTHRKRGISPEDLRATHRGGYREEELLELAQRLDLHQLLYNRQYFFLRIGKRGLGLLLGWSPRVFERMRPLLLFLKWLDRLTGRLPMFKRNQMQLVWGFSKDV